MKVFFAIIAIINLIDLFCYIKDNNRRMNIFVFLTTFIAIAALCMN